MWRATAANTEAYKSLLTSLFSSSVWAGRFQPLLWCVWPPKPPEMVTEFHPRLTETPTDANSFPATPLRGRNFCATLFGVNPPILGIGIQSPVRRAAPGERRCALSRSSQLKHKLEVSSGCLRDSSEPSMGPCSWKQALGSGIKQAVDKN